MPDEDKLKPLVTFGIWEFWEFDCYMHTLYSVRFSARFFIFILSQTRLLLFTSLSLSKTCWIRLNEIVISWGSLLFTGFQKKRKLLRGSFCNLHYTLDEKVSAQNSAQQRSERLDIEDFFKEIDSDLCQYTYAFRDF